MDAARCGSFAMLILGMRGLSLDCEHALFQGRVASLPTALFSGSDMPVCASVVRCDIERLVVFMEELSDAELRCIVRTGGSCGVSARDELACGAVLDAVDALSGRLGALCARLPLKGSKRARGDIRDVLNYAK